MATDGIGIGSGKKSFDVLYPDLLSKEGLLLSLRKRYVQICHTDLEALDKESLVELYNQYILPLPQRKYRDNLRGREMKRKQILRDKKRRFVLNDEDDSTPLQKKGRLPEESPSAPTKGLVNQFPSMNAGGVRLKPPPSCIDTSRKVVKLSSSSPSVTHNEDLEKKSPIIAKTVKLTNDVSSETVKRQGSQDNESEDDSPKKKISKITWP